jgi:hypothetical protein
MIMLGDRFEATGHYSTSCVGAPDAQAAESGAKLWKRVVVLVKKLKNLTRCK